MLMEKTVRSFVTELASDSPAPGGGSAAALAGSLGAALTTMVCNLSLDEEKFKQSLPEILIIRGEAAALVTLQADTASTWTVGEQRYDALGQVVAEVAYAVTISNGTTRTATGVATAIKTTKFNNSAPSAAWLKKADQKGLDKVFLDAVHEIYRLNMYETFWKQGWTTKLARQTRQTLIPKICAVVMYAWYAAYREAGL